MSKALFLLLLATVIQGHSIGQASALDLNFKIHTQNTNKADPDAIAPDKEFELLKSAIQDTYPHLPKDLQAISRKVTFVVNHTWLPMTKVYMGWSAEDDPEYRMYDTAFFNADLPAGDVRNGTIKANFTQKFIKAVALGKELGAKDPQVLKGITAFWRGMIAHELEHARQYHTGPVNALADEKECPDGLCDRKLLAETETKINRYERDALMRERTHTSVAGKAYLALAGAIENYEKENPKFFTGNGEWRLLSKDASHPFTKYYIREEVGNIKLGRNFSPSAEVTYVGQYIPPKLVWQLKDLNDAIEPAKRVSPKQRREFDQIMKQWKRFAAPSSNDLDAVVKESFPFLSVVEVRFKSEAARFEKSL